MKYFLFIAIIIFCPQISSFTKTISIVDTLSISQMDSIAMAISFVQINYDEIKEKHEQQLTVDSISIKKMMRFYKPYLHMIDTSEYDFESRMTIPIVSNELNPDAFCYNTMKVKHSPDWRHKGIIVTRLGKVYLIGGFWKDEYESFIKNEIKIVNETNIRLLLDEYLRLKYFDFGWAEIIDDNNIEKYKKIFSRCERIKLKRNKNNFKYQFFFNKNNKIYECDFSISKNLDFKFTSKVVYEY